MFDILPIRRVEETEIDTAIKSSSANGTVKTRKPYTKIRKSFTISTAQFVTASEFLELDTLYKSVGTVTPFVFDHPTEIKDGHPAQYTVRFTEPIKFSRDANNALYFEIADFKLEEV